MRDTSKPWQSQKPPRKLLAIRFHALGDIIITLPYLASLKKQQPQLFISFLTTLEFSEIPKHLNLFDEVIMFNAHRNGKLQFLLIALKIPFLRARKFDIVLDLQNNKASRLLRHALFTKCWSEFDKRSKEYAGERTRRCIDALGIGRSEIETRFIFKNNYALPQEVCNKISAEYIIVNPAGSFSSRNWPLQRYVEFCNLWINAKPSVKFVILGTAAQKSRANELKKALNEKLVDLTGMTTQVEAFIILKSAKLVLTEDGGLMHMAWVQGVPTLALFGSTPSYWSSPLGRWSICLSSSDLPCGNCFLEICKYGDNRCLTRYTSQFVFEKSMELLSAIRS